MQALQSDIKFIKSILKSWENVAPDMIQFERLAGLSNVIYRVTALDELASPASIIYRKFGENEEIIDRGRENYIFTELAKNGLGPSFYGGDDKSRLEEYYDSRALKPSESSNKLITRGLAKSLASLHQAKMDDLSKTPMILQVFQDGKLFKSSKDKAAKDIFTAQEKEWVEEVMTLAGDDEVNFIKEILPKKAESVVFSHNDLHAQNVLLLDQSQKLVLIDYEYSSYNYRGYDIANFFNEATINYSVDEYPFYTLETHKYPGESDLLDFIKYYLFFVKFGSKVTDEQVVFNDEAYIKNFVKEHGDLETFNTEVEEILGEVRVCAMLSHYYWVLWSVVMSKNPEVGFDYLHYAKGRYDVYQKLKQEFIAAQQGSPKSQ